MFHFQFIKSIFVISIQLNQRNHLFLSIPLIRPKLYFFLPCRLFCLTVIFGIKQILDIFFYSDTCIISIFFYCIISGSKKRSPLKTSLLGVSISLSLSMIFIIFHRSQNSILKISLFDMLLFYRKIFLLQLIPFFLI